MPHCRSISYCTGLTASQSGSALCSTGHRCCSISNTTAARPCAALCSISLRQRYTRCRSSPDAIIGWSRSTSIPKRPQQAADFAKAHGIDGDGLTVLTGDAAAIRRLTEAAGFPSRRDDGTGQYAHPAGFVVATPDGTISCYLLGLDWRPLDLRLALAEAAGGGVAAPAQALLLFCYCYDPQTGRYDLAIGRLLQVVGAVTLLGVGRFVLAARRVV